MVTIESRRLAATATVAPTMRAIAVIVVTTRFFWVTKNTMYAENAVIGVCRVIEMMTVATTAMTRRSVMAPRPGESASSRRSHCSEAGGWVGAIVSAAALMAADP